MQAVCCLFQCLILELKEGRVDAGQDIAYNCILLHSIRHCRLGLLASG